MKNKIINSLFLLFLLFSGCTYWEKKAEYENYKGSVYLQESLQEAKNSPKEKAPTEDIMKKYTSYLEILERNWKKELPARLLKNPYWDFKNPSSKKLQKLVKKGKGEDLLGKEVTLELLMAYSYLKNPSLQKAYQKLQATLSQYSQAAFLEEMVFSYQSFTRNLNTRIGMQLHRPSLSQRYPYPSTLSLKGEILEENFALALENYQIAFRGVMVRLLKAYYQILYLEKAIAITKSHQSLLSSIHKVIVSLYESGKSHHSTVLRIQVELSQIADLLITLEQKRITSLAALNRELSRDPQSLFGKFKEDNLALPKAKLPDLFEQAKENNQEFRIATRDVNRMGLMVKLLRERFHPDFVQGQALLEEGKRSFYGERKGDSFPSVIRSMPRFWFASQESYLREVEIEKKRTEEEQRKILDRSLFQVKKVYYELDETIRQYELYRVSLLPRAEQAYQVASKGYEGGRVSFDGLIDAERVLLRFQLRLYEAMRDKNFKVLELWSAVGRKL